MDYEYPVSKCHVRRAELSNLRKFRERLSVWREWLSGDEHSIWGQIHRMLWNDMVFRTINECRRLAYKNPSPNVDFNRAVASFIDQSYAADQLLAIRRLTDVNVRRDAITLPRLLNDMKTHADLFTREIYVCHDGLPFDPRPAEKRFYQGHLAKGTKPTTTYLPTTGPEAFDIATLAHEQFDRLLGVDGRSRSRDDKLDLAIFDKVKSKLGACARINKVASKFIAHAADAGSRGQLNVQERSVTLDRIETCQQAICRVAAYINGPLLYFGGVGLVSTPQFNHLEHLDKGWLDPASTDAIDEYWDRRAEKIEEWTQGGWDKLLKLPG